MLYLIDHVEVPLFTFRLFILLLVLPLTVLIWIPVSLALFLFGLSVCIMAGPIAFCHIVKA